MPTVFLFLILGYAFGIPYVNSSNSIVHRQDYKKQQSFVQDVLSGRAKGSSEDYLNAMRVQEVVLTCERRSLNGLKDFWQNVALTAVMGILCQITAIHYIHRRLARLAQGISIAR